LNVRLRVIQCRRSVGDAVIAQICSKELMASPISDSPVSDRSATHPRIYNATLGTGGDVIRGAELTEPEAVLERRAGRDVVVCGKNLSDNRDLAERIEKTANGKCRACPPHFAMGPGALPHFQPDPRPPEGHCFYETTKRKSIKSKAPKKP